MGRISMILTENLQMRGLGSRFKRLIESQSVEKIQRKERLPLLKYLPLKLILSTQILSLTFPKLMKKQCLLLMER